MNIHEKLHVLRRRAGLSQTELASQINVARKSIGHWELGLTSPTFPMLARLAGVLGVSVGYLIDDSQAEPWLDDVVAKAKRLGRDEAMRRLDLVEA